MRRQNQMALFEIDDGIAPGGSSTFINNMALPVHRWFRYSAGFSAEWVEWFVAQQRSRGEIRLLDPFAGSATTLLSAEDLGVASIGIESHPFICRVAKAKLLRHEDPVAYREFATAVYRRAEGRPGNLEKYPDLIRRCYTDNALLGLDRLRTSFESYADGSAASELTWLTLVSILRNCSHVGTAQWQYVLPRKAKKNARPPFEAFAQAIETFATDMLKTRATDSPALFIQGDARRCEDVSSGFANLVVTSPPYPNNYDYADATRLEMTFMREVDGWAQLQESVRRHLVRSCSQHTTQKNVDISRTLCSAELKPIAAEISEKCAMLAEVRLSKGGKKNYHLMIASYFLDLAQVWHALRRVCGSPCEVCFVVGDSAPYGIYIPVYEWLGKLAIDAGFESWRFEKIRDRNIKWKNRKHRVPLSEGRLLVTG